MFDEHLKTQVLKTKFHHSSKNSVSRKDKYYAFSLQIKEFKMRIDEFKQNTSTEYAYEYSLIGTFIRLCCDRLYHSLCIIIDLSIATGVPLGTYIQTMQMCSVTEEYLFGLT